MMKVSWPATWVFWVLSTSAWAGGEIQKYIDEEGTILYTNVPRPGGARGYLGKKKVNPAPDKRAPAQWSAQRMKAANAYRDYVESAASYHRIPRELVYAVMHAESGFDPNAISSAGAQGLMQLMPTTARAMAVKDTFDPKQNIQGGVRYLRVLANQFNGDMKLMLAAYNAGPEAVRKYGTRIPPYEETMVYVDKVVSLYFQYKKRLAQMEASAP